MFAVIKRFALFSISAVIISATLYFILSLATVFVPALRDMNMAGIAIMGGVMGFGGAFINLAISRWMLKRSLGIQVIDPATATGDARWLVDTVHRLAKQAGIETMPEVGIWETPEVNALCTGAGKNASIVVMSTGILQRMNRDELEGVIGHELSHATNGDMVTMTLLQGLVSTFAIVISMIVVRFLNRGDSDDERGGWGNFFMNQLIFNVVQGLVGLIAFPLIIGPFSRAREYRADAGGAQLSSKAKMIAGLQALMDKERLPQPQAPQDPAYATLMLKGGSAWFSTHPSLEERIARLQKLVILR